MSPFTTQTIRAAWQKIKSFGKNDHLPVRPTVVVEMACHLTNCRSSACSHVHPAYLSLAPLDADARQDKTVSTSDSTFTDTKSLEASSDNSRGKETVSASDSAFTQTDSFWSNEWSSYSEYEGYELVSVRVPVGWTYCGQRYLRRDSFELKYINGIPE